MDSKKSADKILYSGLSEVCHAFYRMYFPHELIASSIDSILKKHGCKDIIFFGGLVDVAKILHEKGYKLTFVDYTEEMVCEAKKILFDVDFVDFVVSDMRTLNLDEKKDAVILMGRIMTYMYTDKDVMRALSAFRDNLKSGGILIMDNYETGIIDNGNYFNGTVELKDNNRTLRRISKMERKKDHPALYEWDCIYENILYDNKRIIKTFSDKGHILRAFTKDEIRSLVEKSGLKFMAHMPNFEKRSFITIAQKR